jgi:hypothetical protein
MRNDHCQDFSTIESSELARVSGGENPAIRLISASEMEVHVPARRTPDSAECMYAKTRYRQAQASLLAGRRGASSNYEDASLYVAQQCPGGSFDYKVIRP